MYKPLDSRTNGKFHEVLIEGIGWLPQSREYCEFLLNRDWTPYSFGFCWADGTPEQQALYFRVQGLNH